MRKPILLALLLAVFLISGCKKNNEQKSNEEASKSSAPSFLGTYTGMFVKHYVHNGVPGDTTFPVDVAVKWDQTGNFGARPVFTISSNIADTWFEYSNGQEQYANEVFFGHIGTKVDVNFKPSLDSLIMVVEQTISESGLEMHSTGIFNGKR